MSTSGDAIVASEGNGFAQNGSIDAHYKLFQEIPGDEKGY